MPIEETRSMVAFVGTPNSGKSTLFNAVTGLRQKVGNFPGVTIEPAYGSIKHINNSVTDIIDLPGTYSLSPKSEDEALTVQALRGVLPTLSGISALVVVIEGTNAEKGLFLYSYLAELQIPVIVAVTMIDAVKAEGGVFDDITLSHTLGVPVIGIVGHKGIGIHELQHHLQERTFVVPKAIVPPTASIEERHRRAEEITAKVCRTAEKDSITQKIDSVVLHPIAGPITFAAVMLLFFQSIFSWATPLMDGIETFISAVQEFTLAYLPPSMFADFLVHGILAGVGSVIVFLPQIVILYLFISLLEDFGYLARAAFLTDRFMGLFGLQGRSFIPLLGSYACAIPGIMSARIIPSEKDRLTTILIAPLMTCSARLPVYVLLITAFIPEYYLGGVLGVQGLVLTGLYILGGLTGLIVAKILKSSVFRGDTAPFFMELPPYRMPRVRNVIAAIIMRGTSFLKNAGTVILFLSVALWALSTFPQVEPSAVAGLSSTEIHRVQLEQSALGQLGKTLEPIFAPIGFDWKITIGVLGSFAAREVFVSVMGQVYAADVSESDAPLRHILTNSFSLPVALSILVFYVYALQCMSTIAVLKRESGSWKWAAVAFSYTFALAYGGAFIVYTLASHL